MMSSDRFTEDLASRLGPVSDSDYLYLRDDSESPISTPPVSFSEH